jgi:hypothetical protein
MAKTTGHIIGTEKLNGYAKIFCSSNTNTQLIKRVKSNKNPLSQNRIREISIKLLAAKASWNTLKSWKKHRWMLCSMFLYGNFAIYKCAVGRGGYSLYIKEFLRQNTQAGKQPISPCSRRITDITANPWDYTP